MTRTNGFSQEWQRCLTLQISDHAGVVVSLTVLSESANSKGCCSTRVIRTQIFTHSMLYVYTYVCFYVCMTSLYVYLPGLLYVITSDLYR